MICSRDAIGECMDKLTPEHFFIPAHHTIYSVLCQQYEKGTPIDLITFTQELRDRNLLETVGGAAYITSLFTFVPTAANVSYYSGIVRDKFVAREIISRCTELVRVAYDDQAEVDEVLEHAQQTLVAILVDRERGDSFRHVSEAVQFAMDRLDVAYHHRGQEAVHGLATGFYDFDRMTTGLQPGQFIVLGARPSQGKTSLALNFAANMAIKNKVPLGLFSLEMTFEQLGVRLMASYGQVPRQRFRDGFLSEADFKEIPERAGPMMRAPMWIDDSSGLSIAQFRARARLMKLRYKVSALVVDYVQLMSSDSRRAKDNLRVEITEISAALKATAKELELPVIGCAQLNREAEGREFGRPRMADLKESGALEQDADIVALLWRPERHLENPKQWAKLAKDLDLRDNSGQQLYGRELSPNELKERDAQIRQYANLIVAKQRDGPVGEIPLRFVPEQTLFQNVTKKAWSNNPKERQQ
jgi:replicative DNA helicase